MHLKKIFFDSEKNAIQWRSMRSNEIMPQKISQMASVPTTFWFILTNSYFSFLQIIMDNYILYSSIRKGYPIPSNWQLDNQDKDI